MREKYALHTPTILVGIICCAIGTSFFDPINWPKVVVMLGLLPSIVSRAIIVYQTNKFMTSFEKKLSFVFLLTFVGYFVSALASLFVLKIPITRVIWGLWGRNNGFATCISLTLLAFAFCAFSSIEGQMIKILQSLELISVVYCAYGFVQFFGKDPIPWSQKNQVFSFFGNPNFASAIFALAAINTLLLITFNREAILFVKFLRYFFFCCSIFLAYSTKSIQGLAALLIAVLVIVFVRINFQQIWKRVTLAGSLMGIGIFCFVGTLGYGPLGETIGQYTLQLRFQYWIAGIKMGLSSPLWGVGIDSYGDHFRTVRSESLALKTTIDLTTNNSHNFLIQSFATMGIFGILASSVPVILGLILCLRVLVKSEVDSDSVLSSVLFISLWAMAFFSIDNISIAVWNYSFLGCVLGNYARICRNSSLEKSGNARSKVLANRKIHLGFINLLAAILGFCLFLLALWSSSADRGVLSALKLGLDQTNSQQRDQKISQIMILADHPFLMESEYWYLALELNRMSAWEPLTRILSKAITQYPEDFNILDINAGYLEQKELFSQAIPFRERQIAIEPRHPRVWLSYAYDLNAAGRKTEAGLAFGKVVRFKEFLDPKIISQLSEIAKELGVSYSG